MTDKTFRFNDYHSIALEKQKVGFRLNATATVTQLEEFDNTFIAVSMEGTDVAASDNGRMTWDKDDKRGFYLERVDIGISIDDPSYYVAVDSPATTMGSESTTSSSQLDLNVNAGTFGPVPTGGVAAGVAIGTSFSVSLNDWRTENNSRNAVIMHSLAMAASEGAPYESAEDLLDTSVGGQFKGTPLYKVPHISIANLPVLSSGIFVSKGKQYRDTVLSIGVTVRLASVEKTFEVVETKLDTSSAQKDFKLRYPLPISLVK